MRPRVIRPRRRSCSVTSSPHTRRRSARKPTCAEEDTEHWLEFPDWMNQDLVTFLHLVFGDTTVLSLCQKDTDDLGFTPLLIESLDPPHPN